MAVVRGYDPQVSPAGQLMSRADPNDFGAAIGAAERDVARSELELANAEQRRGAALGDAGANVANAAQAIYRQEVENEVTQVHTLMAEARAKGAQDLEAMRSQTQPGDQTFVQRVGDNFKDSFKELEKQFTTPAARRLFAGEASNMRSQFMSEAVAMQSKMEGEFARNNYTVLTDQYGAEAARNQDALPELLSRVDRAIDDPNSSYSRIPQATRDQLKYEAKEKLTYSAALGFVRRNPGAVLANIPGPMRAKVQDIIANPPEPGLPPNLHADTVAPYDKGKITYIANKIDAPSQYDATFKAAANKYNLDWRELKMRSVAESNLEPKAASSQGAGGIMQMTEAMANDLGVNRNDPTDAIFGAARLLSRYRQAAGGDMSKVDMMYYGGESGKAWGANTHQYAANLAAVRQQAGLGTPVAPENFAGSSAAQLGHSEDWKQAKTGIPFVDALPADKFFHVVAEAEHMQRAYEAQSERSKNEAARLDKEMQDARYNGVMNRIVSPDQNGGAIDEASIMQTPGLDGRQKEELIRFKSAYERDRSAATKPHPETFNTLMDRIYAPETDASKIYSLDPIIKAFNNRNLNYTEFKQLQTEVLQLKEGGGDGFLKEVGEARALVSNAFMRSVEGQVDPASAAAGIYRFSRDMQQQIEKYRKDGKDPRELLDPDSKAYLLSPERLQRFKPSRQDAMRVSALNVMQDAATQEGRSAQDGLEIGKPYQDKQGAVKLYRGGPKTDPNSWIDVTPMSGG